MELTRNVMIPIDPVTPSQTLFAIDGQLLRILVRASLSFRHEHVQWPTLHSGRKGYCLETKIAGGEDPDAFELKRRVWVGDCAIDQWQEFTQRYAQLDHLTCSNQGVYPSVKVIQNRRFERLVGNSLTFLNGRQIALLLHFYRLAYQQKTGSTLSFQANQVLNQLGYKPTPDGGFAAKVRSQLNQDLATLHRTELQFPRSLNITSRPLLQIKHAQIEPSGTNFDFLTAADLNYQLADRYTVSLGFFEGVLLEEDCLYLPCDLDISQRLGISAKQDYRLRLLIYLANQIAWGNLQEGDYVVLEKNNLLHYLDLLGKNNSRNSRIFWRSLDALRQSGYLLGAAELSGKQTGHVQIWIDRQKLGISMS